MNKLGGGSHGSVYEDLDPSFVTKRMSVFRRDVDEHGVSFEFLAAESINEPVSLLRARACGVPNIVQLHGINYDEQRGEICLKLEKLDRLEVTECYDDAQVKKFVRQLFEAVAGMHRAGVYNCDIKIDNLMLTPVGKDLRVIDFGLANIDNGKYHKNKLQFYTKPYRPPEIILLQKTIDLCKADTWAAGVAAAEMMLNRECLFGRSGSSVEILSNIMTSMGGPTSGEDEVVYFPWWLQFREVRDMESWHGPCLADKIDMYRGSEAADFIAKVLKIGPNKRPTAEEMLSHPYLGGSTNVATFPVCRHVTRDLLTNIAHIMFCKYDSEVIAIAAELLDHLGLPARSHALFSAAVELISTYLNKYLCYNAGHDSDKTAITMIIRRPETYDFLSQYMLYVG